MRKLAVYCMVFLLVLGVSANAFAEPRVLAELCPMCMHDTTYGPRLEHTYYTTTLHEDHSDMLYVQYFVYYYSCTNSECGYSWATDERYWVRTVEACPDLG